MIYEVCIRNGKLIQARRMTDLLKPRRQRCLANSLWTPSELKPPNKFIQIELNREKKDRKVNLKDSKNDINITVYATEIDPFLTDEAYNNKGFDNG